MSLATFLIAVGFIGVGCAAIAIAAAVVRWKWTAGIFGVTSLALLVPSLIWIFILFTGA
jgi:hypothetical protein